MRVGLYFDARNPPEWATESSRLYAFTLEMCEEAEHLGCHSIWLSEHHRFDDGYLPQPLTLAAAVAARTRRARIGTAIVIAPLHHPAELAEQAAIVDIISGGRLELGLGAGYRRPEFDLYGADFASRYTETDGRTRELRRLWDEQIITPGPVQRRLPIWMGYQGPKGARRAGLLGEGLLSVDPGLVEPYRKGLVDGGYDPAQARMAGGIQAWISDDPDADWPIVARHLAHQVDSYRRHMVEGTDQPIPRAIDPDRLREREIGGPLSYFIYGTPEDVATRLRTYLGDAPVKTVYFWASLSGMPERMVASNVRMICTRLAPLLASESDELLDA
jgi:alkanesulfonate monooxygenase SsuD/methylene tetrahydromethanopterin reductase-like flavin-dependent oxidoreductase (luciferase family)